MNYQGSSFPTDNIPQLGYTDNGQRPPFHPPQVVPYGGKYMTSGYHPPPASITNSNSGNSTTENAADSFNQTKVSLGRDASIYQETSSNSVPVSVNVHVNMSPGVFAIRALIGILIRSLITPQLGLFHRPILTPTLLRNLHPCPHIIRQARFCSHIVRGNPLKSHF